MTILFAYILAQHLSFSETSDSTFVVVAKNGSACCGRAIFPQSLDVCHFLFATLDRLCNMTTGPQYVLLTCPACFHVPVVACMQFISFFKKLNIVFQIMTVNQYALYVHVNQLVLSVVVHMHAFQ